MKGRLTNMILILLLPVLAMSQGNPYGRAFWRLDGLNGAIQAGGSYRYLAGTTNEIYNTQNSSLLYAGIRLNTSSHFWHPNFLWIDLGAEYNPEKGQDLYLVVPDQSEVRTLKKLDATATFFRQKNLNFSAFINLNESYNNRENLSNIRSNTFNRGGTFSWTNKYLPVNINYRNGDWKDEEVGTGRTFDTHQSTLEVDLKKSFATRDNNELRYSHNDFSREDVNRVRTANVSDVINLNDIVSFDLKKKYTLTSFITATDQRGNDAFRRLQADENVMLHLPARLELVTNYNYFYDQRMAQTTRQNTANTALTHRLYESLTSTVRGEYSNIRNTAYTENNMIAGIDLRYDKKIPRGVVSLTYTFNWQQQDRHSDPLPVEILHEQHVLSDGSIELLSKPFVTDGSVVVRDVSGTIIYQLYFDYILVSRDQYLEIQRVPGGQIPNNGTVFADYTAMQPGSYRYDGGFQHFGASVTLFNRLVEVYYKYGKQDYFHLESTEFLILNYFTRQIAGVRLEYKFASGGVEYESYASSILPYRLLHYYVLLQGQVSNKFTFSLNGDVRDYRMVSEQQDQLYADVTGKASYMIGRQTGVSLEFGYRKQVGSGIDLNLLVGRGTFFTVYRQFQVYVSLDAYGRDYLRENTSFLGGSLRIVRTFNWNRK